MGVFRSIAVGSLCWVLFIHIAKSEENPMILQVDATEITMRDGLASGAFDYFYAQEHNLKEARFLVSKGDMELDLSFMATDALKDLADASRGQIKYAFPVNHLWTGEYGVSIVATFQHEITGKAILQRATVGKLTVEREDNRLNPAVITIKRQNGHLVLKINGKVYPPLFFSCAVTSAFPDRSYTYAYLKEIHDLGIRLFAPIMHGIEYDKEGNLDFRQLDSRLLRLVMSCPDAFFALRLALPISGVPDDEREIASRRPGDFSDAGDYNPRHGGKAASASAFSQTNREKGAALMSEVVRHIRAQPYGERVIGLLFTASGFEGNFGSPQRSLMDVSPAVTRSFAGYLKEQYATEDEVRLAWGMPPISWDSPPLPGIEARTWSEIAGFRGQRQGRSRWITDFADFYSTRGGHGAKMHILNAAYKIAPDWIYPLFALTGHNFHNSVKYAGGNELAQLTHPAQLLLTGILGYTDRKAGGVSAHLNLAWESANFHDKMIMVEADIRTPAWIQPSIGDPDMDSAIEVIRREFGHVFMVGRHAMWFFDMGTGSGWWDFPELKEEVQRLSCLAEKVSKLPHRNIAETVVVTHPRSWQYFALTPNPLGYGAEIPAGNRHLVFEIVTSGIGRMMRSGTSKKVIIQEDLLHPSLDSAQLFIFPYSFYFDKNSRERIHRLVNDGAVAFFCFGAGIVDEDGVRIDNMQNLLKMKIGVGAPGALIANWYSSDPIWSKGIPPEPTIGSGGSTWHRFYVEDKTAVPLARYEDDKVAVAAQSIGKGWIVYSAVPVLQPWFYRNLSRFSGVHVYSDADDALYASDQFLVVHTKDAGTRSLRLPGKISNIVEVFGKRRIKGDFLDQIDVELPAKHTSAYYIGGDPDVAARLISPDQAER